MSGQENTRFGSQTVTIRGREHRLWQIFTKEPKRQGVVRRSAQPHLALAPGSNPQSMQQTFRWKLFGSLSRLLVWTCTKWPQPGTFIVSHSTS
jgi:hypothetical protein